MYPSLYTTGVENSMAIHGFGKKEKLKIKAYFSKILSEAKFIGANLFTAVSH